MFALVCVGSYCKQNPLNKFRLFLLGFDVFTCYLCFFKIVVLCILQVALTDMGLMYSWGSGVDGALGHGNMDSLTSPRLVEYFGLQQPLFVTHIAAGSDMIGAHTAVISQASADGPAKVCGLR